jgi:hypothetical protein
MVFPSVVMRPLCCVSVCRAQSISSASEARYWTRTGIALFKVVPSDARRLTDFIVREHMELSGATYAASICIFSAVNRLAKSAPRFSRQQLATQRLADVVKEGERQRGGGGAGATPNPAFDPVAAHAASMIVPLPHCLAQRRVACLSERPLPYLEFRALPFLLARLKVCPAGSKPTCTSTLQTLVPVVPARAHTQRM